MIFEGGGFSRYQFFLNALLRFGTFGVVMETQLLTPVVRSHIWGGVTEAICTKPSDHTSMRQCVSSVSLEDTGTVEKFGRDVNR